MSDVVEQVIQRHPEVKNEGIPEVWIWFDHSFLKNTEVVSEAQSKCTHVKWISFQQSLDLRGRSSQDDMLIG